MGKVRWSIVKRKLSISEERPFSLALDHDSCQSFVGESISVLHFLVLQTPYSLGSDMIDSIRKLEICFDVKVSRVIFLSIIFLILL